MGSKNSKNLSHGILESPQTHFVLIPKSRNRFPIQKVTKLILSDSQYNFVKFAQHSNTPRTEFLSVIIMSVFYFNFYILSNVLLAQYCLICQTKKIKTKKISTKPKKKFPEEQLDMIFCQIEVFMCLLLLLSFSIMRFLFYNEFFLLC